MSFNGIAIRVGLAERFYWDYAGGRRARRDAAWPGKARQSMQAGAAGLISGRSVWQRGPGQSLRFAGRLRVPG